MYVFYFLIGKRKKIKKIKNRIARLIVYFSIGYFYTLNMI